MKRIAHLVTVVAASSALLVGAGVPAGAATDGVRIDKISSPRVASNGKATVKPRVTGLGKARLGSARLTVKQGRKTVVRKKKSAKLKAGSYTVTTRVSYQVPVTTTRRTTSTTRTVGVAAGTRADARCTVGPAYEESVADVDGTTRPVAFFDATCRAAAFDPLPLTGLVAVYLEEFEFWAAYDGAELVFVILAADYASLDGNRTVDAMVEPEYDLYRTTTRVVTTSHTTWKTRTAVRTQKLKVRKR